MPDSGDSGKTKVQPGYPIDVFNHGIKSIGDGTLVRGNPVEVTKPEHDKLAKLADQCDVPLEEVS